MQEQNYREASRHLLGQAFSEWKQGDLRQSSEKGWGAAAQMVKAVSERRGWRHNAHPLLTTNVVRLAKEASDNEIRVLFNAANQLHTNFYEDRLDSEWVEFNLQKVSLLLDKLEPLSIRGQ